MTTENIDHEPREGGARIEELPASDIQLNAQDRERPSPLRAPPGEPDEPEAARSSPPPDPGDLGSPSPRDPEE